MVVAGEVRTTAYAPVADIVRAAVLDIGYDSSEKGFDGTTCGVQVAIGAQSSDIAQGVDHGHEARVGSSTDELDARGAGDQGLMFGYACDDTDVLMPLPIVIAQRLAEKLTEVRKNGTMANLRPDGKTQVTIEYDADDRPVRIDTVVVSTQHSEDTDLDQARGRDPAARDRPRARHLRPAVRGLPARWSTRPAASSSAGRWATPASPAARSSSTPTAAWPATVAAPSPARTPRRSTAPPPTRCAGSPRTSSPRAWPAAARCRSPTRSARPQPVGVFVQTFGTGVVDDEQIQAAVLEVFDLRPAAILRDLDLLRPIYAKTSAYGHFGRELPEFTWERTDRADALKAAVGA